MRIVAILVAYDPARDPRDAVSRLSAVVERIIIVDNHVSGHPAIGDLGFRNATILRNNNVGGLAGAYNMALDWIDRHHSGASHLLFVDDDSDVEAISAFTSSPTTIAASSEPDVAAVAPIYRDRRTGLRGAHIQLGRFGFRFLPREQKNAIDVTFVINSMSLWRREAIKKLGRYSTSLAIDHIDTEYAMRAKRAGYRIVLNADVEFAHEIGERQSYKFLGKTMQSGGHSANRRFMIGRNTVIIAKKHGPAYPAFAVLCLQRIAYETIGILVVEDRKRDKLIGLWRGVIRGLIDRA